ncbi:hypothetical protein FJTKL_14157 [Diaporthe vaccinii]|uniref:Uncharacterized protein n=1 Tax=Diaporthe vaccinii TaxID=105482 RepID=A0ABR4E8S6_9PEZI
MKLTFTVGTMCLLGAAHAQNVLLQCAVQGNGDYNVGKTAEYTSPSCRAAGGSLGSTPGGGRAGGISCCTTPTSGKDKFYSTCKTFGDGLYVPTPQPC